MVTETPGNASRNARMTWGTKGWKGAVGATPTRSLPCSPLAVLWAARSACSSRARMIRASSSSTRPLSVSSTPRGLRRNSRSPSCPSSALICWLSGGCPMPSRSAARVTCPSSATATK